MPKKVKLLSQRVYMLFKDVNTFCKIDPARLSYGVLSQSHFTQMGLTTTGQSESPGIWALMVVSISPPWRDSHD